MKVTNVEKKEKSTVELTIQVEAQEFEDAVHAADYIETLFGDIIQNDHELFDSDSVSPELDQTPSYKYIISTQNEGSLSEEDLEEFEEDYEEDYELGDEL